MADHPDRPGYSFDPGPPPEVSRFFRNKGLSPSFSFRDVEPEEHAVAFTVAKMAQVDMLQAAKAEVQRAIDEGQSFEQFKRAWRGNPALAEWWGQEMQTDPLTGEQTLVQLGTPRRLKTIYRANLRSARAAGQWERVERTKRALPYLEYRLGPSERHRPHHAAKEGTILPVDSPFWARWMPPNGWGCKCWIRQITRREAERRGVSAEPAIDMREWTNPRTGETRWVPVGLDPSWDNNPGQQRRQAMERLLDGRLTDAPEAVARVAMRDLATSWRVERIADGAPGRVTVGFMPAEIADELGIDPKIAFSQRSAQHVFGEKTDRERADLRFAADLADADRAALITREDGLRTLVLETDAAVSAEDGAERHPLRFHIHLLDDGAFVGSMRRNSVRKWAKLLRGTGVRELK